MSGSTTVNLSTHHTDYTTRLSNVTIDGGNANYTIIDYGNNATIIVGNGDQYIYAAGTGNIIEFGSTPDSNYWYCDGDSQIFTGGSSFVFGLGAGDVNVTAWGGNNFVSLMNGDDTLCLSGNNNTISTGDGNESVEAPGTGNNISLGNSEAGGVGNSNFVWTGGGSTVVSYSEYNEIDADGNGNYITTTDGVQTIVASGTGNIVTIGNTVQASNHGCGWYDSWGNCYSGQNNQSVITTGSGATVTAGNGEVQVVANSGNNTVTVGNGDDSIYMLSGTGQGHDTITVGSGANAVFLAGASNTIYDGGGSDVIQSGTGSDSFVINASGGNVEITGFQATDTINLSQLLAGETTGQTATALAPYVTVSLGSAVLGLVNGVLSVLDAGFGQQNGFQWGGGCGGGGQGNQTNDTVITAHGASGTATIQLDNYNVGNLATLVGKLNIL